MCVDRVETTAVWAKRGSRFIGELLKNSFCKYIVLMAPRGVTWESVAFGCILKSYILHLSKGCARSPPPP
jgi:hypothetical protein